MDKARVAHLALLVAQLSNEVRATGEIMRSLANAADEAGVWEKVSPFFEKHIGHYAKASLILGEMDKILLAEITGEEDKEKPN